MADDTKKSALTGLEIAVIGMAGRFPGAGNIEEFWHNLKNAVESITFYEEKELAAAGIDPGLLKNPGYVRAGGGILENSDCFDASFFGYLPGEAEIMDPQVRIFHECSWEALEDAGYAPGSYNGMIGVYAGATNNPAWEFSVLLSGKSKTVGEINSRNLSNKEYLCLWVSYKLNLKGPAVEINTTCSTSLVAIHMACRALWTKECDIALAGGVSIMAAQKSGYLFQEGMIMSSDGHCRAFDARATGIIHGRGAGVVVLKKLKDAVNDGDNIYAVIKGTAINNDGLRKVGFTAPSIEGQSEAIKTALHIARVEPESIGYIETHGTGTIIGDPIEIEALTLAFNTSKKNYCPIGSVKTNIGHLDAAAGAVGFIKTVLALKYRLIPPSLHFENPNPKIDFDNSPFFVNTKLREWKNIDGYPLRAGVSSFGLGGTNAHVVLEAWPAVKESREVREGHEEKHYQLILLSAKSQPALDKMTENLAGYLQKNAGLNLADAAYTLSSGRETFEYKKTIVCTDVNDAVAALTSANPDKVQVFQTKEKKRPVVFMFPGQGAQYANMGLELYRDEPVFRQEMDQCFEILKSLVGYDLKEILFPTPGDDRSNKPDKASINETEITQPVIFAFEYALARLLMSWGINPHAMTGHSIGEYTAACLSGVFSLADALKLTALRGRLMQGMPPGAMLSVSLPEEELRPLLNPGISLAAVNSSSLCVISGAHEAVEKFETRLKEVGCTARRLHTSHAFHSAMMEPILAVFEENVKKVRLGKPMIPFISGVTGHWISTEKATNPGYWARHLRETVNFRDGLSRLLETKDALFIEVGPGNVLSAFLRQHKDKKAGHFVINMVRHPRESIPGDCYLASKIGQLWLYGVKIDWPGFYAKEKRYRISLPTYPFERRKFLFNTEPFLNKSKIGEWCFTPPAKQPGAELTEPGNTGGQEHTIVNSRSGLTKPYAAPCTETQHKLANLWQDFFGMQAIGIDDDFFELGGDSLKAATIIARVHRELDVQIPFNEIFRIPTVRALSEFVEKSGKDKYRSLEPVEKKEFYELSSAQRRYYILQQMDPDNTGFNLCEVTICVGELDMKRLGNTFEQLIKRHEIFRTSFALVGAKPVQKVHPGVNFDIEYFDLATGDGDTLYEGAEEKIRHFIRPFDLSRAPLLRVGIMKIENEKHLMMIDVHHIASDGLSQRLLVKEFLDFYRGVEPPPLRVQYKDFAEWQNSQKAKEELEKQEEYWLKVFNNGVPALDLPIDFARDKVQKFEGDFVEFAVGKQETKALKDLAANRGVTAYMIILALCNIWLAKICSQDAIAVGSGVGGRKHPDLENLVGSLQNMVVMINRLPGEQTFGEFLENVRQTALSAFENQDYPFDQLAAKAEAARAARESGRNPLFDFFYILNDLELPAEDHPHSQTTGLKFMPYPHTRGYKKGKIRFDLALYGLDKGDTLSFMMEYSTKLFKQETAAQLVAYFKEILATVLEHKDIRLKDIAVSPGLHAGKDRFAAREYLDFTF